MLRGPGREQPTGPGERQPDSKDRICSKGSGPREGNGGCRAGGTTWTGWPEGGGIGAGDLPTQREHL